MPKHIFRLSLFVLLALGGSIRAEEVVFIGTSMKTLAGLYKVTYGFAFGGHAISISQTSALSQPVEETVLVDLRLISASILHRPGP